ncbi:hypothetical protein L1765_09140 [Microaerobacter geothermalis]|uniref:hypothetical protein n=1 Tax=Microaerobacter geothermalis TaxID=674972 RepID=UPI001F1908E6|nr:hypothetical protein [Microaerobacter geothermalis]MCF6094126.1 hypothetical protein [Microaerobacter geothermalis]
MKNRNVLLILLLVAGLVIFGSTGYASGFYGGFGNMMGGFFGNMMNGWNGWNDWNDENWNGYGGMGGMMGGSGGYGMMGGYGGYGMMGGYGSYEDYTGEPLSDDELINKVEKYIEYFNSDLVIGDLFKFSNSDYYVSVMEQDTGRGAFELLVNPYTGAIYPEQGPNMMWNQKYGMMGRGGMGGMMGSGYWYGQNGGDTNAEENVRISMDKAVQLANDYLSRVDEDLIATDDGHQFYGYYTLHVEKDGKTVGMLSVSSYTGSVWYHNWHGDVSEVIEGME